MRFDDGSKQFEFQTRKLNPKERSKIEHEINTNYSKYENQELCIHYSFALDNKCYKYYFENHGFNSYNIYSRKLVKSKRR